LQVAPLAGEEEVGDQGAFGDAALELEPAAAVVRDH